MSDYRIPEPHRSMCLRAVTTPGTESNGFRIVLACGHSRNGVGGTFGAPSLCPWCVRALFPEHAAAGELPATW